MTHLAFDYPWLLLPGGAAAAALVCIGFWRQKARGMSFAQASLVSALRAIVCLLVLLLLARPIWVHEEIPPADRKQLVLLVDSSASMSVEENGQTRLRSALEFINDSLAPALSKHGLEPKLHIFSEQSSSVTEEELANVAAAGSGTNLAGAIASSLEATETPPFAVVALTDGAANESRDVGRAAIALSRQKTPFVGIGFGGTAPPQTLTVQSVDAPARAAPKQQFRISARLDARGSGSLPAFDLLLLRDGVVTQRRRVQGLQPPRTLNVTFMHQEAEEGQHEYTVQAALPAEEFVRSASLQSSTLVRINQDEQMHILYAQGALTWDYKFAQLAITGDEAIKITGLSRTSDRSVMYQNADGDHRLSSGFPDTIEELTQYSAVVLSNHRLNDFTPNQRTLLARYCAEYGGGLLMIGGPETFDSSWRRSELEEALPVRFAVSPFRGLGSQFYWQIAPELQQDPLLQIDLPEMNHAAWGSLPAFEQFASVEDVKPAARVWAYTTVPGAERARVPLMVTQPYGSGRCGVILVQNFWRWRLARNSNPLHYDRFWRQLFRYLSAGNETDIRLSLLDQEIRAGSPVQLQAERSASLANADSALQAYQVRVLSPTGQVVFESELQLQPGQEQGFAFVPQSAGVFTAQVLNPSGEVAANRAVDVSNTNREWLHAARDMDELSQWAANSDGLALTAESCGDMNAVLDTLQARLQEQHEQTKTSEPAFLNAWYFMLLGAALCGEWSLRKKWGWK